MALDLEFLGSKLKRYREQLQKSLREVSEATGISELLLDDYENGKKEPTGDEILILADHYKCDYKFFISNERLAAFEQTETLYRRYGQEIAKDDRWAIQEFLFLCECEEYLIEQIPGHNPRPFMFIKQGSYYKKHGEQASIALRQHLGYQSNAIGLDVYEDFRRIGIHVFRRQLQNSKISGLYIRHPSAGKCILVNYNEDIYRQRFTAAHETAHAILDDNQDVIVSFTKWQKDDLSEVRANTFASYYLMPPEFLRAIPDSSQWNDSEKVIHWANRLKVSTGALAYALRDAGLIPDDIVAQIKSVRLPAEFKTDPELPVDLSPRSLHRRRELLRRGLSVSYVNLCFDAYEQGVVSAGRLAELLLIKVDEVHDLAKIYGRNLVNDYS